MVSRLIASLLYVGLFLVLGQPAPGGIWEQLDLGLVLPPVGGLGLLGLDADADGVLWPSQTYVSLSPNIFIIKKYRIFKVVKGHVPLLSIQLRKAVLTVKPEVTGFVLESILVFQGSKVNSQWHSSIA